MNDHCADNKEAVVAPAMMCPRLCDCQVGSRKALCQDGTEERSNRVQHG
jgi:hypothetical protein